jgi:hypothetical protein
MRIGDGIAAPAIDLAAAKRSLDICRRFSAQFAAALGF